TGEVEPVRWAKVSTQVPGRVETVLVEEGDAVMAGQALAEMEDHVERARLTEFEARLQYLEKEKKRTEELMRKGFASKSTYDSLVSEYDAVKAQLESQHHVLHRLTITTPLDGTVLKRDIEPGETATMVDILFWIGDAEHLRITAEVDEEDIALVRTGQNVLIKADAFPDQVLEGTVTETTPKGDPVDKNFRLRVSLPEDSPLMIGMTVEINIVTKQEEDALLVPVNSVRNGRIWVIKNGAPTPVNVTTGIRDTSRIQILDGLKGDETILATAPANGG
ncbi:MAG: efflux RND transporter periplasmic adaptor subunit, partial [Alphaproteobacteria bacterium]